MSNGRSRVFELARGLVDYADSNGYSPDELFMAIGIIHESTMLMTKIRELTDLLFGDEDDNVDVEEEIKKMMDEAEEAINDVD